MNIKAYQHIFMRTQILFQNINTYYVFQFIEFMFKFTLEQQSIY